MIKQGTFCVTDEVLETPLHKACRSNISALEKIKTLIAFDDSQLLVANKNGYFPLHLAAKHTDPNVLKYIIKYYDAESINSHTKSGLVPLHIASFYGIKENVIELLARAELNVNATDGRGNTALHMASAKGHSAIIKILKEHPICVLTIENHEGLIADQLNPLNKQLWKDTETGTLSDIKALIKDGAICIADTNGNTPLHHVCFSTVDPLEKAKALISKDRTQLLRYNNKGRQPIHVATDENCVELFKLFLSLEHSVEQSKKGHTLMHVATKKGFIWIVQELMGHHPSCINAQDAKGNTPAHLAAMKNHQKTLRTIQQHPEYRNIPNKAGKYADDFNPLNKALMTMCRDGTASSVQQMLSEGAKCIKDTSGNTLLHMACTSDIDSHEKCQIILRHDPSLLREVNNAGDTPLHVLSRHSKNIDTLKAFLGREDIDFNALNKELNSPLHEAWTSRNEITLDVLIMDPKVDINMPNKFRRDLLHLSALENDVKLCLRLLSQQKLNVNAVDANMQTTLHIAAKNNHLELTRALLAHPDIDFSTENVEGDTVLSIAEKLGHTIIAGCIRNHPSLIREPSLARGLIHCVS